MHGVLFTNQSTFWVFGTFLEIQQTIHGKTACTKHHIITGVPQQSTTECYTLAEVKSCDCNLGVKYAVSGLLYTVAEHVPGQLSTLLGFSLH